MLSGSSLTAAALDNACELLKRNDLKDGKNEMIFGIRAVIEAVEAGKEIDKILIKKDLQGDLAKELFDLIKGRGFFVQRVPVERLNRITRKIIKE